MNSFKIPTILTVICLILLQFGCMHTVNSSDYEKHLNGLIDRPYYRHQLPPWEKISEDELTSTHELKMGNGCSYALVINKKTYIVESWKFTSERTKCDNIRYFP
jgi:hypothetical protein